jgi:hypothetical protein
MREKTRDSLHRADTRSSSIAELGKVFAEKKMAGQAVERRRGNYMTHQVFVYISINPKNWKNLYFTLFR